MEPLEKSNGLEILAEASVSNKTSLPCVKKEEEIQPIKIAKRKMEKDNYNMPYKKDPRDPKKGKILCGWLEAHLRMKPYKAPDKDYFIVHFHKRLTRSDVKENLNRLLIPKDVAHKSLIPEMGFEDVVKAEKGPLSKGIKLVGLDRAGRKWNLEWKWWSSSDAHILIGDWMKLVKCNGLKADIHNVDVSVFGYGKNKNKFCFLILHSVYQENKEKLALPSRQKEEQVEEEDNTKSRFG